MKLLNRLRWCCKCFSVMTRLLKICSTVLRPGLKPAWSSASNSSALAFSRLRITRNMILLGWLNMLMVRSFLHYLRWPFYGKGMTSDCVHSFISHIFWHITVRTVVVSPPFLDRSEGMLSTPGDFPALVLRTASSASSLSTGRLSASCVGVWLLWSRLVSGWSS